MNDAFDNAAADRAMLVQAEAAIALDQAVAIVRDKLNLRGSFFRNRQERQVLDARRRERRNAAARGRSDAMRSLGMTRTLYGWE